MIKGLGLIKVSIRNFSGDFGETEDVRSVTFRFQIKEGSRFDDFADLIESMRQEKSHLIFTTEKIDKYFWETVIFKTMCNRYESIL